MGSTYEDLVDQALYSAFPVSGVKTSVRLDAIAGEIIGTKQRRFGPMPVPEVQVQIRNVIRDNDEVIRFFVPFAARKQEEGAGIDLLEFFAVRQLQCLQQTLADYGVRAEFTFRAENLADVWLFGRGQKDLMEAEVEAVEHYALSLRVLVETMLEDSYVCFEGDYGDDLTQFYRTASARVGPMKDLLQGEQHNQLIWKPFTEDQIKHYTSLYSKIYPGEDWLEMMAIYFAGVKARQELDMLYLPKDPFVFITFEHPVPGDPSNPFKLRYRTLPAKHTHHHYCPWMRRGYFQIDDLTDVTLAKYYDGSVPLTEHEYEFNGIKIQAPYYVKTVAEPWLQTR